VARNWYIQKNDQRDHAAVEIFAILYDSDAKVWISSPS
jgi:hypothetical protein